MGTLTRLRSADKPRVTAIHEHGAIVVRVEAAPPVQPPDELRPIGALAEEWGLERRGLETAIRRAGIATVRIGRQLAVRRSDVVALVDRLPRAADAPDSTPADAYAALVACARGGKDRRPRCRQGAQRAGKTGETPVVGDLPTAADSADDHAGGKP